MLNLLKAGCLLIYGLALAAFFGHLPGAVGHALQTLALVFGVVHVLEVVVMYPKVRLYPGPLAMSIVLTLLFGLLHWMPLAQQNKRK